MICNNMGYIPKCPLHLPFMVKGSMYNKLQNVTVGFFVCVCPYATVQLMLDWFS
jgi:hypothetical protein